MYLNNVMPLTGERIYSIALGAFTDDVFPPPTVEFFTKHRHGWVAEVPGAVQLGDPLGADAEAGVPTGRRPQPPRLTDGVWAPTGPPTRGWHSTRGGRAPHRGA